MLERARPRGRGDRRRQRLDRRQRRARRAAGARVVARAAARLRQRLPRRLRAPPAATYIVMADADLTYDFDEIPRFVERARRRRRPRDGRTAWTTSSRARCRGCNRYVGNPVLSGFLNLLYRTGVKRRALRHAGACAATCSAALDLRTTGMEFASEMVIRAAKQGLDDPRVPDRVPPARRRVQAVALPRRLAPPAADARPQPERAVHLPGAAALARRGCDRRDRARATSSSSGASGRSTR